LLAAGMMNSNSVAELREQAKNEVTGAIDQALSEPSPTANDLLTHTFAPSRVDAVYPDGYTGLPT
jgi:TPP-dependent pyruvate/acetoin dehydrogenase alpha subunit